MRNLCRSACGEHHASAKKESQENNADQRNFRVESHSPPPIAPILAQFRPPGEEIYLGLGRLIGLVILSAARAIASASRRILASPSSPRNPGRRIGTAAIPKACPF